MCEDCEVENMSKLLLLRYRTAINEGKCVVIGLQSTGEARLNDVIEEKGEELEDFISTPA